MVTKVSLVVVKVVFAVARVLEKCPGNYRTKSGHSQARCIAHIGGRKVD